MSDTVYRDKAKEVIAGELFNKLGISQSLAIEVASVIDILPSANEWIPCSERLPNLGEDVLVTIYDDALDIGWFEHGERGIGLMFSTNEYCIDVEENVREDVTAWQPLPTPYKGE